MAEDYIPGIYNYCDRWCERCPFTSRCKLFATENESADKNLDINNQVFWEKLAANFVKAKEMLQEAAKKSGIDLNSIKLTEDEKRHEDRLQRESMAHPLAQLGTQYARMASEWLKTQPGMLAKLESLKSELTVGVQTPADTKKEVDDIKDAVDVINWYHTFIPPKLVRALMSRLSDDYDDTDIYDSEGSAKIAIISIERSMQAWARLYEMMPENEDQFLNVLSILQRMLNETKAVFPKAMEFVRPGLDDTKV